jgi:hypothetical protein
MKKFDRRVLKKEGEELQQYLQFRRRGSIVENKKKNKKLIRKKNKDMCHEEV